MITRRLVRFQSTFRSFVNINNLQSVDKFINSKLTKSFTPHQTPNPNEIKSILLATTPSLLKQSVNCVLDIHKSKNNNITSTNSIELILVCIDSICWSDHAVSVGLFDKNIKINNYTLSSDKKDPIAKTQDKENGINGIFVMRIHKEKSSKDSVVLGTELASTMFQYDHPNILFTLGFQNKVGHKIDGQMLNSLDINLPVELLLNDNSMIFDYSDNLVPISEEMKITSVEGNIIKTIDNRPASEYLTSSKELMEIRKDRSKVYIGVNTDDNLGSSQIFEVVAGGGEWGDKAAFLVINNSFLDVDSSSMTRFELENGMKVVFYLDSLEGKDSTKHNYTIDFHIQDKKKVICIGTKEPNENYISEQADSTKPAQEIQGLFSMISQGINGVSINLHKPGTTQKWSCSGVGGARISRQITCL